VRIITTLALVVMLLVSAAIVVLTGPIAQKVGDAVGLGNTAVLAWDIAKWPVLLLLVSIMIALLYYVSPNLQQPRFRWITPGGLVAVAIWLLASGLFALYVSFAGSYNKTYGSLATVIVFLVWLWITNIAILFGAEFNAEMQRQRAIEGGLPEDVEPFADLRDTRKLDEREKKRVAEAARIRKRTLNE
jgi:membrane protein